MSRAKLVLAVAALGLTAMFASTGTLGRAVTALSGSVDGMIAGISATPTPKPTVAVIADAPLITAPEEPYTLDPSVDLVITVPADVIADPKTKVRVYRTLPNERPRVVVDVPVGDQPQVVVPITLVDGHNPFSATLVGPGGESDPSPVVTWVLDRLVPKIKIYGPPPDVAINRQVAKVTGKTQSRAILEARNETSGEAVSGSAAADGTFAILVPIVEGPNRIILTSTDPAGNEGETTLDVLGGDGKLTATLSVEPDDISIVELPTGIQVRVAVLDPDEQPLEAATVTFTLSLPGIQVIVNEVVTDAKGEAIYRTTVPEGTTVGDGSVAVLVQSPEFGEIKAAVAVKFVE